LRPEPHFVFPLSDLEDLLVAVQPREVGYSSMKAYPPWIWQRPKLAARCESSPEKELRPSPPEPAEVTALVLFSLAAFPHEQGVPLRSSVAMSSELRLHLPGNVAIRLPELARAPSRRRTRGARRPPWRRALLSPSPRRRCGRPSRILEELVEAPARGGPSRFPFPGTRRTLERQASRVSEGAPSQHELLHRAPR